MPGRIAAQGISVAYGSTLALDEVSFSLTPGTSTALVGPNGSGKTTLLHVLAGLRRPSRGTLDLGGHGPIALVAQQSHQARWMPLTVGEVLRMGRYGRRGLIGRLGDRDHQLVAEAAQRMKVDDLTNRQVSELSGGQRQRVLVAQALAQDAGLLLLDEPITGLDLPSQQRILDVIAEETAAGATVLLSTHHLDEAHHCDRVLLLSGRLVADGPPEAVLTPARLRETYGARLLGDHADHGHPTELLILDEHGHGNH